MDHSGPKMKGNSQHRSLFNSAVNLQSLLKQVHEKNLEFSTRVGTIAHR